jgi:hypothetical protein
MTPSPHPVLVVFERPGRKGDERASIPHLLLLDTFDPGDAEEWFRLPGRMIGAIPYPAATNLTIPWDRIYGTRWVKGRRTDSPVGRLG